MAEFSVRETFSFPPDVVFRAYRDRMLELVPHLPNVAEIEELTREQVDEDTVKITNRWRGADKVPIYARPFVSKEILVWLDHAVWQTSDLSVTWRFEFPALGEGVRCGGRNHYETSPEGAALVLSGRLDLEMAKIPKVPRIARGLGPKVEKFVLGRVRPNLVEVSRAVEALLVAER